MKSARLLAFLPAFLCLLAGQSLDFIEGHIFDRETKDPLPAFVRVEGTGPGLSAGPDGRFRIRLDPALSSPGTKVQLVIWLIGYKKTTVEVRPGGDVSIGLELEPLPAHEVTVSADSAVTEDRSQKTVTLNKMDIYRLPGTAADPLYASHVLPGVNSIPDASSLLIRGGAPDEVAYIFDGIEVAHPFLSESLHEGYFSIFDNQVIEDFSVSTSGFSAKQGDALSGVMDITAKDSLFKSEGGLGLSLLGLNSYLGLPLKNLGSFVGSFNLSHSWLMTRLNGRKDRAFGMRNMFGKFVLRLGRNHTLRILGLTDDYRFSHASGFETSSRNGFAGMSLTSTTSRKFVTRLTLSHTFFSADFRFQDAFRQDFQDKAVQARLEASLDLESHFLEAGLDLRQQAMEVSWQATEAGKEKVKGTRRTLYVTDKFRLLDSLYLTAGCRFSSLSLGRPGWSLDPRFSLAYFLGKCDALRLSAGVYSQFGDYFTLEQEPRLKPRSATHYSLSYDRATKNTNIRFTFYDKEYRNLALEGAQGSGTSSEGRGYARGAELFIKQKSRRWDFLAVYNYLNSRRKENEVLILARSPYEIAHSLTGIVTWKGKNISLGLRYSYASGLPYTPLLDREWDEESQSYQPLWGEPFSQRCPAYQRCDFNGSWTLHVQKRLVVLYFGITNLFNNDNILRYEYNEDYSVRQNSTSIFGRTFFVGLYVPFF